MSSSHPHSALILGAIQSISPDRLQTEPSVWTLAKNGTPLPLVTAA
jgi:hypothetical protein